MVYDSVCNLVHHGRGSSVFLFHHLGLPLSRSNCKIHFPLNLPFEEVGDLQVVFLHHGSDHASFLRRINKPWQLFSTLSLLDFYRLTTAGVRMLGLGISVWY